MDLPLEIPPPGEGEGRGERSLIDGGGKRSKRDGLKARGSSGDLVEARRPFTIAQNLKHIFLMKGLC